MKFEEILSQLKQKIYHPIYVLSGEETYFIDVISDYIEDNVLTDMEKEFNMSVLWGKETDISTIISYAKRFPMMSNYQVVIVKEAQNLTKIEELAAYAENPLKSTILVLVYKYKTLDKRKSFAKLVDKKGVLFESSKLYDNQLPEWINNYIKQKGFTIEPKASVMLSEFLGNDLSKICNEISKLIINIPKNTEITSDHIEKNIGISKDFNIFELQNALGKKNVSKANQIVLYFAENPKDNPLVVTISTLYKYFTNILKCHYAPDKSKNTVASLLGVHPFFAQDYITASSYYSVGKLVDIIKILKEYDLKSKGVDNASATEGELLKEMIYKILH